MISEKMQQAISSNISAEIYSSYLYLSMSAYCESIMYKGFARWLRVQHKQELEHATKMLDYLLERGGRAKLGQLEAPPHDFQSVIHVFESVLEHERKVTRLINDLFTTASQENDLPTQIFLQLFVAEQVEEEAKALEIVEKLRMVGDRPGTILYLDKEYGKRTE